MRAITKVVQWCSFDFMMVAYISIWLRYWSDKLTGKCNKAVCYQVLESSDDIWTNMEY